MGNEYNFGPEGMWVSPPRQCGIPGMVYNQSIEMGRSNLTTSELQRTLDEYSNIWDDQCYDLVGRNCNDFCNVLAKELTGTELPSWINGLAHTATFFGSFVGLGPSGKYSRRDS